MPTDTPTKAVRFFSDEEGATAIEYGLIAALVTLVLIGGLTVFSGSMTVMYSSLSDAMTGAAAG